jgi:two-component system cell cycle sensor histidine kinase/response regulator CckA
LLQPTWLRLSGDFLGEQIIRLTLQFLPMRQPCQPCRRARGLLAGAGLLAGLMLGAATLGAQDHPAITSGAEFWTVPEYARKQPQRIDVEILALHYDPNWKLLYGEVGGTVTYLPTSGQPLPLRAGQRVRLQGTVVTSDGLDGDKVEVTVLAEGQFPTPLPTAGKIGNAAVFNGHWVELEGHVLAQSETDFNHLVAVVWSEGRRVEWTMLVSGTDPVPQLIGAHVRIHGVYDAALDAHGSIQSLKLWTPGRAHVELLGWLADDPRFKLPAVAIERLAGAAGEPWVRIAGRVQARQQGVSLTVRDDTGEVVIETAQPEDLPVGARVEVIGRVAAAELGWTLKEPLYRRLTDPGASPATPSALPMRMRLVEPIMQLSTEEAARRHPVTLRGVVTWANERAPEFYLQDVTGGVAVRRPPGVTVNFGTTVTVTGVTERGTLRPVVEATEVSQAGNVPMPAPRRLSLDQALAGAEEGRLVEMRGFVRGVAKREGWTRLDLTAPTGEFAAYLPPEQSAGDLAGAIVWVRGVCVAQPGTNDEPGETRLWVQARSQLVVEVPGSADPFAAESQTIDHLRHLTAAQTPQRRVRVTGVVTHYRPGRYLYVQDGDAGLFVLTRENGRLAPGDTVELSGLPGRAGNRPVLREAVWRPAAPPAVVAVHGLDSAATVQLALDTRLVRTTGRLRQASWHEDRWTLALEAGDRTFEASVPAPADWLAPRVGSLLELTGVYVVEFDEYRRPHDFSLEMRGASDVRILELPPWWTSRRVAWVSAGLGVAVLLAAAWVAALRRRVRAQTEQIRLQLEKEARLQSELERSARLESLGVLAGGIAHDFNNLLTAILGNLGLAAMDRRVMDAAGDCISEAERGARRARDITQQLLTFAKGGDPVRTAVSLPEVLTEAANFARHGANVRLDFDFPSNLPPGNVDAGQISRVVHNLVINAVQAMPQGGVVSLALAAVDIAAGEVDALAPGSYLRLTIADTGRGIPAEVLPRIFDPYFSTKSKGGNSGLGLAAVRSIIKKHNGHIDVQSEVGRGTTFRIWLPAAPHVMPEPEAASPRSAAHLPAKILVMDDEDVIRRVAGRMLALAGHETVFAADGAEAVRAYVAARRSGQPFDLVIFDLTVPGGMGGKEALEELLKTDPAIRAIASSGYSSDPVMANPRSFGFRVSLPKPYGIPDLTRAVEEARRD